MVLSPQPSIWFNLAAKQAVFLCLIKERTCASTLVTGRMNTFWILSAPPRLSYAQKNISSLSLQMSVSKLSVLLTLTSQTMERAARESLADKMLSWVWTVEVAFVLQDFTWRQPQTVYLLPSTLLRSTNVEESLFNPTCSKLLTKAKTLMEAVGSHPSRSLITPSSHTMVGGMFTSMKF